MTLVVDTSALVAVLRNEPSAQAIAEVLGATADAVIGTPTLVEVTIVIESRLGPAGVQRLTQLLRRSKISVVEFTEEMCAEAVEGFRRYGKGRHPAALNLGDCHTYGVARALNAAVLCIGTDFTQTDLDVQPTSPSQPKIGGAQASRLHPTDRQ